MTGANKLFFGFDPRHCAAEVGAGARHCHKSSVVQSNQVKVFGLKSGDRARLESRYRPQGDIAVELVKFFAEEYRADQAGEGGAQRVKQLAA